jgi:hypothetical protein
VSDETAHGWILIALGLPALILSALIVYEGVMAIRGAP